MIPKVQCFNYISVQYNYLLKAKIDKDVSKRSHVTKGLVSFHFYSVVNSSARRREVASIRWIDRMIRIKNCHFTRFLGIFRRILIAGPLMWRTCDETVI